jgi:hypothetical protein
VGEGPNSFFTIPKFFLERGKIRLCVEFSSRKYRINLVSPAPPAPPPDCPSPTDRFLNKWRTFWGGDGILSSSVVDPDPVGDRKLNARSGKNNSGSRSRKPGSGMNLNKNLFNKFTISQQNAQFKKDLFSQRKMTGKL